MWGEFGVTKFPFFWRETSSLVTLFYIHKLFMFANVIYFFLPRLIDLSLCTQTSQSFSNSNSPIWFRTTNGLVDVSQASLIKQTERSVTDHYRSLVVWFRQMDRAPIDSHGKFSTWAFPRRRKTFQVSLFSRKGKRIKFCVRETSKTRPATCFGVYIYIYIYIHQVKRNVKWSPLLEGKI